MSAPSKPSVTHHCYRIHPFDDYAYPHFSFPPPGEQARHGCGFGSSQPRPGLPTPWCALFARAQPPRALLRRASPQPLPTTIAHTITRATSNTPRPLPGAAIVPLAGTAVWERCRESALQKRAPVLP
ncbi:hypothetical protein GCM10009642_11590 [Nocardiopsis metallicus]